MSSTAQESMKRKIEVAEAWLELIRAAELALETMHGLKEAQSNGNVINAIQTLFDALEKVRS